MRKLETIQTKENLNSVFAVDEKGPGGANHKYAIVEAHQEHDCMICNYAPMTEIQLQCGPRKEFDSLHGVIDTDLLEIVRDRLKAFQEGPFASQYNDAALNHIECALNWMNKRVEDRIARNVLGKNEK